MGSESGGFGKGNERLWDSGLCIGGGWLPNQLHFAEQVGFTREEGFCQGFWTFALLYGVWGLLDLREKGSFPAEIV